MTFARESLLANRSELEMIFTQHWSDVSPDFKGIRLGFDWDTYASLESIDALHFIVARDDPKKGEPSRIVGYQMCIIRPHIHSKDSIVATTTFFFMLPEYRKGWAGVRLFQETERSLLAMGIHNVYVGCKSNRNLAPIFVHLGYHEVESVYAKELA